MKNLLICLQILLPCCMPNQQEMEENITRPNTTWALATPDQPEEATITEDLSITTENAYYQQPEIIDLCNDERIVGARVPTWVIESLPSTENTKLTFMDQEVAILWDSVAGNFNFIKIVNGQAQYGEFEYIPKQLDTNNLFSGSISVIKYTTPEALKKTYCAPKEFKKISPIKFDYENYHHTCNLALNITTGQYEIKTTDDNPYMRFKNTPWANQKIRKNSEEHFSTFLLKSFNASQYCSDFFSHLHHQSPLKDDKQKPTELILKKIDGILFSNITSGETSIAFPDLIYQDQTSKNFYFFNGSWIICLPAHPNLKPIEIKKQLGYLTLCTIKKECTRKIFTEKKSADLFFYFK